MLPCLSLLWFVRRVGVEDVIVGCLVGSCGLGWVIIYVLSLVTSVVALSICCCVSFIESGYISSGSLAYLAIDTVTERSSCLVVTVSLVASKTS